MKPARAGLGGAVLLALAPNGSDAQAWLPFQGEGNFSLSYENYHGGDHLFSSDEIDGESSRGYVAMGKRWFLGDLYRHTLYGTVEYGIVDRLAVTAGLAWLSTRYDGRAPISDSNDDGFYHGTVQDFTLDMRFQLISRPFAMTPVVGVIIPTHDYERNGHAGAGPGLTHVNVGVWIGRFLDPVLPRAYLQGAFLYSFMEDIEPLSLSRSFAQLEAGYYLTRRFSLRARGTYARIHGGVDWITGAEDCDPNIQECDVHGDAATRIDLPASASELWRLGAGATFQVASKLVLWGSFASVIDGRNTEDSDIITFGMHFRFLDAAFLRRTLE